MMINVLKSQKCASRVVVSKNRKHLQKMTIQQLHLFLLNGIDWLDLDKATVIIPYN